MSDITRDVSLGGLIFAEDATPTQGAPVGPTIGTPYRNEELTQQVNGQGWPFSKIVNSADFNEIMYRITSVLDAIEVQGILFWSDVTDYVAGSIVRRTSGSTEKFFEALQASGPSTTPKDPAQLANIGVYWKEASIGGAGGGYAVQFVSTTLVDPLEKNVLYFCTGGNITLTLPSVAISNGDKIKIATGSTIGIGSTVTISGAVEDANGTADTELIIDTPFSSVELIYNSTAQLWKVCSPISKGVQVASSVPVGSIVSYAVNVEPPGFLICDGRAVSRTQYNALFSVLGTIYGAGDGSTTFNIPDFRGKFLRGYGVAGQEGIGELDIDDNGGYSGTFGTEQKEQLPNIRGSLKFGTSASYYDGQLFVHNGSGSGPDIGGGSATGLKADFNANNVNPIYKDGGHNAPANFAVHFLIKY